MMQRLRLQSDEGFTLIELLVVIAIIGILAAIAIPQFAAYRRRGYVAQVQSDIHNIATAEEASFAQNQAYLPTVCDSDPAVAACTAALVGFTSASLGVTATVTQVGGNFQIVATHGQCAGDSWTYTSVDGATARAGATC